MRLASSKKGEALTKAVYWFDEPEDHNYPAAEEYLTLLFSRETARGMVDRLRRENVQYFKAKDIFRASKLPHAGISNEQVEKTLEKIEDGKKLSPVLLLRSSNALIIADGYHRVCAVYSHDQDVKIPCKIV